MKIVPVIKSGVNWSALASVFDPSDVDVGGTDNKIWVDVSSALGLDPWKCLHYGFYFEISDNLAFDIISETLLKFNFIAGCGCPKKGILSGSMDQWIDAIRLFCNEDHSFDGRAFFNVVLRYFESTEGFRLYVNKRELKDRTFVI